MPQAIHRVLSESVLNRTMHLFWEKGYANTAIEDIVEVTGFNRAAIYSRFGGKHGLFLAMLKRYRVLVTDRMLVPLKTAQGLEGIVRFFQQFAGGPPPGQRSFGCFIVATASDIAAQDDEIGGVVADFLREVRELFVVALTASRHSGELVTPVGIAATADFLVGNLIGLMTLSRSPAPREVVVNHANGIVAFLQSLYPRPA